MANITLVLLAVGRTVLDSEALLPVGILVFLELSVLTNLALEKEKGLRS